MLRPLALLAAVVFTTGTFGAAHGSEIRPFEVQPRAETEPAKSLEDAADDAEVWLNKADPSKSIIFGTDKKTACSFSTWADGNSTFFPSAVSTTSTCATVS